MRGTRSCYPFYRHRSLRCKLKAQTKECCVFLTSTNRPEQYMNTTIAKEGNCFIELHEGESDGFAKRLALVEAA